MHCAFDLLELDGEDLRRQPIEDRKRQLVTLLRGAHSPSCSMSISRVRARSYSSTPASSAARLSCRSGSARHIARAGRPIGEGQESGRAGGRREAEEDGREGLELRSRDIVSRSLRCVSFLTTASRSFCHQSVQAPQGRTELDHERLHRPRPGPHQVTSSDEYPGSVIRPLWARALLPS